METLLERVKKEELPEQYQKYFDKKGGGALYLPLNESSTFGLFGGSIMVIFFGAIIFSIIEDTYQYPTYENLIWFALFAIMVLVGIRVFYMAFKKKLRVANYNWPYGLYFDSEAMLIATESYFTLVPRQSVYLQQKRDINYDRYNGRIVYAIRYHGVWDFGADLGGLSDSVIQKFDQWVATGDKFSFYL